MTNVYDVAAYILSKSEHGMSAMKLQKLTYLSQGWSLGITGKPIFDQDFEAWMNGPVSRDLYRHHRRQYHVSSLDVGNASSLADIDEIMVDLVISNYGAMSGQQLSEMSHAVDGPWKRAREMHNVKDGESSTVVVSKESIREYFHEILSSPL